MSGPLQPFTKDQTRLFAKKPYGNDLFWLTAGAMVLHPDRENSTATRTSTQAGQKGDRIKGHPPWTAGQEKLAQSGMSGMRGRSLDDLTWNTLEGIGRQTALSRPKTTEGLDHLGGIPGRSALLTRGGQSGTMYAGVPGLRQYAGFSTT